MMVKKYKGEFGYIEYRKKLGILRTGIFFLVVLILFVLGLIIFKSQKNFLSIIAALLCLPTGWSAVNLIMFIRYKGCSESAYSEIEEHKGQLLIHYDHIITSYDKNFPVAASTVLDKNIICFNEYADYDASDLEAHIKKMLAQNGYSSYSIKVFDKLEKFLGRLDELEKLRAAKGIDPAAIEDAWTPGTLQTPAGILLSISL